jgi:hypothetical protein
MTIMPYCSRCGVEVDAGVSACPLCEAPIFHVEEPAGKRDDSPYPQHIIDPDDAYRLSKAERRRIGIEILSLAAALAGGAVLLVDLLLDRGLGWSRYVVASIALGWILTIAPLALYGRLKATLGAMGAAVLGYLLALDGIDGRLGWSLSLGVPIALASFLTVAATVASMASRKVKGLNLLGIGSLGLSAFLVALEAILRLGLGESVRPYWSIVAALALVPIAVFLFYLHGRVLRGADLRKIFRL